MNVAMPNFDTLVALHQQDPEALEAFRRHLLREAVDSAPAAQRPALEKLLDRIEVARNSAANPIDAASIAFHMMRDSVNELHASWEHAMQELAQLQTSLLIERLRR
ncbi:DUF3135 domain-containing protein [Noviherbaspirillum aerium]|uniref:DUF3135 domain-containing protein n=1 Tax=Noviherbaspirillum aerium TaxID=2588497 RepID=UPI00178C2244|nr:DUF3135 domain-containing protein [Noviherbaspirillum aerium]